MSNPAAAWTAEETAELRRLHALGHSYNAIGQALGKSRNAIIGRAHSIGLENDPSADMAPAQCCKHGCVGAEPFAGCSMTHWRRELDSFERNDTLAGVIAMAFFFLFLGSIAALFGIMLFILTLIW